MTQADLGLADAYINGDFSFVDKDRGLLNLFMVRKATSFQCKIIPIQDFDRISLIYFPDSHCQQR